MMRIRGEQYADQFRWQVELPQLSVQGWKPIGQPLDVS
jgi:hypothetical protein